MQEGARYPPAMARVRLRILLEEEQRTFAPGEEVRGRVRVEVDEDCTCRGVDVLLGWEASGDANRHTWEGGALRVGGGEWRKGQRHEVPFAIPIPAGPPTYDGRDLRIAWKVRAAADLSFAFDSADEAFVTVRPPPPAGGGTLVAKEESGCFEAGCATVSVLFVLGVAVAWFLFGRVHIWLAVVAFLVLLWCLFIVPQALSFRSAGKVRVEVGPSPCLAGEEMAVRVSFRPREDLAPNGLRARLEGVEKRRKGSGKHKKTVETVLATVESRLKGPERIPAGTDAVYAGILEVPSDAAPSFEAGPHAVVWRVKVFLDLPGLADLEVDQEVTVG